MRAEQISEVVDRTAARWGPRILVVLAGLLWLSNVDWKVPPDFGALQGFTQAGVDHPVVPGSAWVFTQAVDNIEIFGWVTLFVEVALAATLLAGRFLRTMGLVGIAVSAGIGLAVANADHEWYWAYLLMMGLQLAVVVVAPRVRPVSPRAMGVAVALYGVVVAVSHAEAGFTGDDNQRWALFRLFRDIPDEFGRNTFTGSIALGLVFVALGVGAWFLAAAPARTRAAVGWVVVGVAAGLLVTYQLGGGEPKASLVIGLGSTAASASVLAALGLSLTAADDVPPSSAPGEAPTA